MVNGRRGVCRPFLLRQTRTDMLELVLKKKWFDMIESGEKKEEYRDSKPYWWRRIFIGDFAFVINLPDGKYVNRFDKVRFRLGYAKDAPSMVFKLGEVRIGNAKPEWAEGHMGRMIVLPLLERIS